MSGWATTWVVRLMIPSVTAAMKATPDDRPSRPSIQLMLLIIPTIQKMVSPAATGPVKRKSGPNGFVMKVIDTPRATAAPARAIWPISWYRARRSNRSSIAPRPAATAPPSSRATTSDVSKLNGIGTRSAAWLMSRNSAATSEERRADGQTAASRHRDGVDPAGLRPVDDLVAQHHPADDRRHDQGDEGGEDERRPGSERRSPRRSR